MAYSRLEFLTLFPRQEFLRARLGTIYPSVHDFTKLEGIVTAKLEGIVTAI
jgi:hypothetical protein